LRLRGIRRQGAPVRHVAEGAAARAEIAEDHERGRALAEALPDVGAARLLADGVQALLAQDALHGPEALAVAEPHADPVGLGERRRRHDLDRDARRLEAPL